jgi:subtilisin family serine protease
MRLGASLLLAAFAFAPRVALGVVPVPDEVLEQAEREGRARVIVHLDAPAAPGRETPEAAASRRAAVELVAAGALAPIGGAERDDLRRYRAFPLLALEASPSELAALAEAPGVLAIEADRPLWPSLAESIPRVGANVTTSAGFDGAGSAVVIVDTGVEKSHPFFGGRVVAEACFSAGSDCPNGQTTDFGPGSGEPCTYGGLCWHGTHVAGIAAGSSATLQGVAPAAQLIAIQVGSEQTSGCPAANPCVTVYTSDVVAALDYVHDTLAGQFLIAAVNLSLGSTTTWSSESACDASNTALRLAVGALRDIEIASVAAAGNGGVVTGIDAPACLSEAIGVGASGDTSDAIWSSSNSGPPLDFWAPGTNIYSSSLYGSFGSATGTSMATPHVAGAFAVLRQADPDASVSELKSTLESTGPPLTDSRNGLVRPRLQVDDAVRARAPAQCFDGLDNDGDGYVDVDGDGGLPDPDCIDGFDNLEQFQSGGGGTCGIGPELGLLLPLLGALRGRSSRRNREAA